MLIVLTNRARYWGTIMSQTLSGLVETLIIGVLVVMLILIFLFFYVDVLVTQSRPQAPFLIQYAVKPIIGPSAPD